MPTPTIFEGINPRGTQNFIPCKDVSAFPRSEQAVLGAKNLFNLDASVSAVNNALYEKGTSGFRVYNTTAKAYSQIRVPLNLPKNTDIKFTAHMSVTSGTGNIGIEYSDNGSDWSGLPFSGVGGDTSSGTKDYDIMGNTGNHAYYRMSIFCTRATSTTGDISASDIMLRLASDTDDTYVPYAMTNKGLTDAIADLTPVEANPSGTATDTLTKLKVGNTVYDVEGGGSITPKVLASVTGDGVKTFNQLFDELYLQLLPIEFDKLIGTVLVTGATCYFLSRISVNDQDVEYSTEYTLASQWGTHDVYLKSSGSSLRVISINNSVISYNDGGQNVAPSGRVIQIVKPSAYVTSSGIKNLLWTNSGLNATVADANDTFPATNSIPQVRNDQGYDYFIIVFRNHASRLMEVNYLLYPDQNDPNNGRVMVAVSTAYNGTAWKSCRRQFGFWNTGSGINTLYCTAGGEIASDGALSEDNHYLIPYKIYGVKL